MKAFPIVLLKKFLIMVEKMTNSCYYINMKEKTDSPVKSTSFQSVFTCMAPPWFNLTGLSPGGLPCFLMQ